jgi:hypothetical protein
VHEIRSSQGQDKEGMGGAAIMTAWNIPGNAET